MAHITGIDESLPVEQHESSQVNLLFDVQKKTIFVVMNRRKHVS